MPAIVGPIYIMSLAGDAAASFGDVFAISPKAVDHSGAGQGRFIPEILSKLLINSAKRALKTLMCLTNLIGLTRDSLL